VFASVCAAVAKVGESCKTTSLFESAALAAGLTKIVAATKIAARLDVIVSASRFLFWFMKNVYNKLPEALWTREQLLLHYREL